MEVYQTQRGKEQKVTQDKNIEGNNSTNLSFYRNLRSLQNAGINRHYQASSNPVEELVTLPECKNPKKILALHAGIINNC
uniref:Uncharacterized protein n=1 Tax=Romanomermis culicivorax TaxID=13658 RepID=A0A915J6G3_ROMCU